MKQNRVERILLELKKMGISQMLLVDPISIYYVTGIYQEPDERFYGLLLKANGKHIYFLNKLFSIHQEVGIEKVWYSDTDPVMEIVAQYIEHEAPLGVDKELKAKFLLPLQERKAASEFINTSLAVDSVRGIKDAEEQEKMRVSSRINDRAMERFKELIHEGVTEKEAAEKMLKIYLDLGADGFSFHPLVAFGANAADPHHSPDDTVLQEGDVILFDVGCIKDGYCSDMTRSFFFRRVTDVHREIYETVREANETAIARIKPGVPLCDLDLAARKVIEQKGYGPNFNHRLGHFIGLRAHEFGDVSGVNPQTAQPGMIFSIEPGIYLAGDMGVRIEDLVLVTETGCEVLNHYSKKLEIIEG